MSLVIAWLFLGPTMGWTSSLYHLPLNSPTTAITFLLLALLHNTQHRAELAMQTKLNALGAGLRDLMDHEAHHPYPDPDCDFQNDIMNLERSIGIEKETGNNRALNRSSTRRLSRTRPGVGRSVPIRHLSAGGGGPMSTTLSESTQERSFGHGDRRKAERKARRWAMQMRLKYLMERDKSTKMKREEESGKSPASQAGSL